MGYFTDFETLTEHWGHYVLPDEIHVKTRAVLVWAWEEELSDDDVDLEEVQFPDPPPDFDEAAEVKKVRGNFRTSTDVQVSAPQSLQGDPGSGPEEPDVVDVYDEFEIIQDPLSIYLLDKGNMLALTGLRPNRVERLNRFDGNGEPVISVEQAVELTTTRSVFPDVEFHYGEPTPDPD